MSISQTSFLLLLLLSVATCQYATFFFYDSTSCDHWVYGNYDPVSSGCVLEGGDGGSYVYNSYNSSAITTAYDCDSTCNNCSWSEVDFFNVCTPESYDPIAIVQAYAVNVIPALPDPIIAAIIGTYYTTPSCDASSIVGVEVFSTNYFYQTWGNDSTILVCDNGRVNIYDCNSPTCTLVETHLENVCEYSNFWAGVQATFSCGSYSHSNVIVPPSSVCGNGVVEGTEECDGGNCCNADCTFKMDPVCYCSRQTFYDPSAPNYFCNPDNANQFYQCLGGDFAAQSSMMNCAAGSQCGCPAGAECSCNGHSSPCVSPGSQQSC